MEEEMFKPIARFVLIAVSTVAFSASAGAQANARLVAPAASAARSAASAAKNADCQAPATIGEDYQGVPCFYSSAEAQANAGRIDPAGSAAKDTDCQPPATVGEDYSGISCSGVSVSQPFVLAPFFSVGEDFSGPKIIARAEGSPAVSHNAQLAPQYSTPVIAGSN
jgi:hypothetical protein